MAPDYVHIESILRGSMGLALVCDIKIKRSGEEGRGQSEEESV